MRLLREWAEPIEELDRRLSGLTDEEWACLEDGPGPWGWDK